jgi:hypothetical protein
MRVTRSRSLLLGRGEWVMFVAVMAAWTLAIVAHGVVTVLVAHKAEESLELYESALLSKLESFEQRATAETNQLARLQEEVLKEIETTPGAGRHPDERIAEAVERIAGTLERLDQNLAETLRWSRGEP